jgi:hypothetical protein
MHHLPHFPVAVWQILLQGKTASGAIALAPAAKSVFSPCGSQYFAFSCDIPPRCSFPENGESNFLRQEKEDAE